MHFLTLSLNSSFIISIRIVKWPIKLSKNPQDQILELWVTRILSKGTYQFLAFMKVWSYILWSIHERTGCHLTSRRDFESENTCSLVQTQQSAGQVFGLVVFYSSVDIQSPFLPFLHLKSISIPYLIFKYLCILPHLTQSTLSSCYSNIYFPKLLRRT